MPVGMKFGMSSSGGCGKVIMQLNFKLPFLSISLYFGAFECIN